MGKNCEITGKGRKFLRKMGKTCNFTGKKLVNMVYFWWQNSFFTVYLTHSIRQHRAIKPHDFTLIINCKITGKDAKCQEKWEKLKVNMVYF